MIPTIELTSGENIHEHQFVRHLETGESVYSWYRHPEGSWVMVLLTRAKHHDSPDVEWINKYSIPEGVDDSFILAFELPGDFYPICPPI